MSPKSMIIQLAAADLIPARNQPTIGVGDTQTHCRSGPRPLTISLSCLAALALVLGGCATPPEPPLSRFEYTEPQMGVPFRIVLYAPDQASADTAARAAYERVRQLNQVMSDYEDDSELNRLSATAGKGEAVPLSNELWLILERSQVLARRTEGAFDITVGPLVNLWRKARRDRALPNPDRLAAAARAVGYQHLVLDPKARTARLLVPNMKLDLGAIAKGYGVDEALQVLRRRGIRRALVAGAGDMALGDPPPGKPGWRIAVAPLDVAGAPPTRHVLLANAAIATSGDVFQRVEIDGQRYSHIVDPHTGVGLTDHSLVTIIARDCATADGLATAVSVLGPAKGLKLIESTPHTAAHIVRKPGEIIEMKESSRFAKFYETP